MSKKKEKVNEISTTDEGTKLVKIIVIILILFAIFYFLTGYVSKYMNKRNNKVNTTPETAVIQYDKIMIGEILNQSIELDFNELEDDLIEMRHITDEKELIIEIL